MCSERGRISKWAASVRPRAKNVSNDKAKYRRRKTKPFFFFFSILSLFAFVPNLGEDLPSIGIYVRFDFGAL